MILRPASRAIVVFLFDLVRFFPMSGQSDPPPANISRQRRVSQRCHDGEVAEGWPILPTTANLLPGAEAAISARETLASAFR
jgi:hypothetical protein